MKTRFWNTTWFRVTIGTLISIVFLFLAFKDVPLDEVGQAFARVNYFWIALALGIIVTQSWLRAWRWIVLYDSAQPARAARMFGIMVISQMLNIVIPWRVGEIARLYLAREFAQRNVAQTLTTLAVEKIFDTLMMFALVLLIPFFMTLPDWLERPREGFILTASGLFLLALLILLARSWIVKVLDKLPLPLGKRFVSAQARLALKGLDTLGRWDKVLILQTLSLVIWLLGITVNHLVSLAMNLQVPLISAFLLLAVLQIGGLVPSSPGKVGVFQILCIWTLALFAVDKSIGLAYGILLYVTAYGPPVLLGILFLWWSGVNLSKMTKDE